MKCSSGCVCSLKRAQRRPCTASSSLPCGRRAVSAAKLHRFPSLALRLGSVGFPLALPVSGRRFALAGRSKVPLQPASSVALLHSVRSWLPPCEACHLDGGSRVPGGSFGACHPQIFSTRTGPWTSGTNVTSRRTNTEQRLAAGVRK